MSRRGRPHEDGYKQLPLPDELLKRFFPKPEKKKRSRKGKTYAHLYPQSVHTPPPEENGQLSTLSTPPTSAIAHPQEGGGTTPSSMYPPVEKGYQDDNTGER